MSSLCTAEVSQRQRRDLLGVIACVSLAPEAACASSMTDAPEVGPAYCTPAGKLTNCTLTMGLAHGRQIWYTGDASEAPEIMAKDVVLRSIIYGHKQTGVDTFQSMISNIFQACPPFPTRKVAFPPCPVHICMRA